MDYRILQPNETTKYRAIRLESLKNYPDSFGSNYAEQKAKAKLGFESYIEGGAKDKFIMGAFRDGNLVGICGFFINQDKRSQHRGEIIQMYVQPAFQGAKIGLEILQKTMEQAVQLKGLEQIELEVFSNNLAAIKIYEKAGFKEYGLLKNYWKMQGQSVDLKMMVCSDFISNNGS